MLISEFKPRTKVLKKRISQVTTWIGLWQSSPCAICYLLALIFKVSTMHSTVASLWGEVEITTDSLCFLRHVWIFLLCSMLIYLSLPTYKYFLENNEDMNNECLQWPNHFVLGTPVEELLLQIDCPSAHSWEHSQDDNWREEGQDWRWWWLWMSMIIVATIMMMLTTIIGR